MLITKKIIPKNRYKVRTGKGGRELVEFNEPYLRKIADTSNRMLREGLNIPAPFDHHNSAVPTKEKIDISTHDPKSSFNNAGYWKRFWVAPDENAVPALYGELDAAGDEDNPEHPAWKVKNASKEVSVYLNNNFEDGLGRKWEDGLMHVAVVNYPIVPGQSTVDDGLVVNMSMVEDEPGSDNEALCDELKTALRKIKVNLTSTTTYATFMRDLLVAVNQLPSGSSDSLEPAPIYMSGEEEVPLSEAQAKALVDAGTTNPATKQPFTMEDLGFKPKESQQVEELMASLEAKDSKITELTALASAFKNKIIDDTKAMIQKRISSLVSAGIITKEKAEAEFNPKVEFSMSIADGKIQEHPLEMVLSTLETQVPKAKGIPEGAAVNLNGALPEGNEVDLTDQQMDDALKAFESDGIL